LGLVGDLHLFNRVTERLQVLGRVEHGGPGGGVGRFDIDGVQRHPDAQATLAWAFDEANRRLLATCEVALGARQSHFSSAVPNSYGIR
jgi:hypothetical protein